MSKIIAGNWKMNGSKSMINTWFEDITKNLVELEKNSIKEIPNIIVSVPSIYLEYMINKSTEYNKKLKYFKIIVSAEDCHYEEKGAFTGNISPLFLNEVNCNWTLIGHSERRQYEKETNEIVSKKSISAINHNITPIICVGEDLKTRESNKYLDFIKKQVLESTNNVEISKCIIAYEPIWAIGTGKVPTENEIDEVGKFIKSIINVKVLYGGSVKSSNSKNILSLKNIDGVLVGGASMKGEEFFNIVKTSL